MLRAAASISCLISANKANVLVASSLLAGRGRWRGEMSLHNSSDAHKNDV